MAPTTTPPTGYNVFGESVAILNNGNLVVAAPYDTLSGTDAGAIFVFGDVVAPPPPSVTALQAIVLGLPASVFSRNFEQRRNALLNKMDAVQELIDGGEFDQAIEKLNEDIRTKADGCHGGRPNNDWIVDCMAQQLVLDAVDALIALLEQQL